MPLYTIMRYKGNGPAEISRAKTIKKAAQLFYDNVYAMCEADGMLDRPIAHFLTKEVLKWEYERKTSKDRTDGKRVLRIRAGDDKPCVVVNWEYV